MKIAGTAGCNKESQRASLIRPSAALVALLFFLVAAKAQPLYYAFNNGLGKSWRIAAWQSPDSVG